MAVDGAVLALNAGSSSLKFGVFEAGGGRPRGVLRGALDGIGSQPRFKARDETGKVLADEAWTPDDLRDGGVADLLDWIEAHLGGRGLLAAGHRIVHGGREFDGPVLLTDAVVEALERLTPLAPLHQPKGLAPVHALAKLRPGLPQVGCFDTAFHHGLEAPVSRFAIPRALEDEGVRRYGFHGLSYAFIAARLADISPALAGARTVVAHLGNGASLCAMRDGKSVDTTMGLSALDGLVMGTRCGAIDPGVLLYLMQTKGMSAGEVEHLLYHECGLLGVSGLSSDIRILQASDDPRAEEAIDLFCFSIARETAAMANSLGGLDAFVFTAGIGEHSPEIRERLAARLAWLGFAIDPDANHEGRLRISSPDARVDVFVIPTDEEIVIAEQVLCCMTS